MTIPKYKESGKEEFGIMPKNTQGNAMRDIFIKEFENGDLEFLDKKGKPHILTKQTQNDWINTFGLDNIEQNYIPAHTQEIKQALKGREVHLSMGSLLKIVERQREAYIPNVKQTIDNPDLIIQDARDGILFVKKFNDNLIFTSVGADFETHITIISNAPKNQRSIKSKIANSGKVLYQSPNLQSLVNPSFYRHTN
ncbi:MULTISPECIES: PBECR2 nuclease fold domain-containing protein [unclassified Helicobacter]|uniref:PBECR2 nuclease fold domain-containing protein n=1 Tax=unclassified Helicobacter TaxID=2593540 RepID=UPI00115F8E2A|nr:MULTISPECIES: PBECR2 nuclease fold domain-containing protein [unclassified Helicobacter]